MPAVAAYSAAKGAIESLTRSVAVHCAQSNYNIRCNSVHPATILTPMVIEIMKEFERAAPPADRPPRVSEKLGEPDDIAHTVLFLASDESKFINGAAIRVDNAKSVAEGFIGGG